MDADHESPELSDTTRNAETGAQIEWKDQAGGLRLNALRAVVLWSILLLLVVPPVGVLAFISACLTKAIKSEKKKKLFFRIAIICCIAGTTAFAVGLIVSSLK